MSIFYLTVSLSTAHQLFFIFFCGLVENEFLCDQVHEKNKQKKTSNKKKIYKNTIYKNTLWESSLLVQFKKKNLMLNTLKQSVVLEDKHINTSINTSLWKIDGLVS